ncbi:MAG: hypothetical protein DWQ05_19555 [Calditrichaeota bacterium]|nr:MAG: hypothetical protein DWQ05_19555 [Calditrichota bacterium]
MKVAIPVWENRISPVFDTTAHILQAEIIDKMLAKKEMLSLESLTIYQRIELLDNLGIDIFICGGITRPLLDSIRNKNIKTIPYVCGNVDKILSALCDGEDIKSLFSMPGNSNKEDG